MDEGGWSVHLAQTGKQRGSSCQGRALLPSSALGTYQHWCTSHQSRLPVLSVPAVPYAVKVACLLCFGPQDWDIQSGLDPLIPQDKLHLCDVPFLLNSLRGIGPT